MQNLPSDSWPFQEAAKILKRLNGRTPEKGYVLFETGYGPSGLPHIGTFGEVVRTTMVRQAFERMSDIPTHLFCVSDDMDALRKVPDNIPNKESMEKYLGFPLTKIPDPISDAYSSFGAGNNARLRDFLDSFGFDYEFKSATESYQSGAYNNVMAMMLLNYEKIQNILLPTLGAERQKSYSIFLPISKKTGKVLQVPILRINYANGSIIYRDVDGEEVETSVFDGNVKLQWKADWAGRWVHYDVDYEMYGKDLITSADIAAKISEVLWQRAPEGFNYELFLDENGHKISKSVGNGISIEEWLRYAPSESLSYYMYHQPRRAKKLYFEVIPKAVDDYLNSVNKLPTEDQIKKMDNPAWHIHDGVEVNHNVGGITFGMLLNLAGVANTEDKNVLWKYLNRYVPGSTPENSPYLDKLLDGAIAYYQDFVKSKKVYRTPTDDEKVALNDLINVLKNMSKDSTSETIQSEIYEVGKRHYKSNELRLWFKALYEILLGSEQGPRMGIFIQLYGFNDFIKMVEKVIA